MYRISNCEFRKAKTKKADQGIERSDKHNSNFGLRIAKTKKADQDIRGPDTHISNCGFRISETHTRHFEFRIAICFADWSRRLNRGFVSDERNIFSYQLRIISTTLLIISLNFVVFKIPILYRTILLSAVNNRLGLTLLSFRRLP